MNLLKGRGVEVGSEKETIRKVFEKSMLSTQSYTLAGGEILTGFPVKFCHFNISVYLISSLDFFCILNFSFSTSQIVCNFLQD